MNFPPQYGQMSKVSNNNFSNEELLRVIASKSTVPVLVFRPATSILLKSSSNISMSATSSTAGIKDATPSSSIPSECEFCFSVES